MGEKTKKKYVTPTCISAQIECEGSFAASYVGENVKKIGIETNNQTYTEFDGSTNWNDESNSFEGDNITWH